MNKYLRSKIMRTRLTLTEIWPIRDRFIKQKYYCTTVHYRTVCPSENCLGQTVQTGQQTLRHLEQFSDYVRGPTSNWIPATLLEWFSGREENDRRNYFMINLQESMGPGRDRTRDPWICSQTRIYCQRRYRLRYATSLCHITEASASLVKILKSHI